MKTTRRIASLFLTALLFLLSAVPAFADMAPGPLTCVIEDGVLLETYGTEVENGVFYVPDGVHTIRCKALEGEKMFTTVYIPASVEKIEVDEYEWWVHVMNGQPPMHTHQIEAFVVDEANEHLKSVDGVLYSKDGKELICYPQKKQDVTDFVVPEDVEKIRWMSNAYLETVTLPEGVKFITRQAFASSHKLKSINLPETLEMIEPAAFSGCIALEKIVWPSSITIIEHQMFIGCSSLTKISLPETLEEISWQAFYGCDSLTAITIPEKVKWLNSLSLAGDGLTDLVLTNPNIELAARIDPNETATAGFCYNDVTLHGTSRSTAMIHALNHNMKFKLIGELDFGDLDQDGKLGNRDVTELLRHLAKWENAAEVTPDNADINLDGAVNNKDATLFLRFLANGAGK